MERGSPRVSRRAWLVVRRGHGMDLAGRGGDAENHSHGQTRNSRDDIQGRTSERGINLSALSSNM